MLLAWFFLILVGREVFAKIPRGFVLPFYFERTYDVPMMTAVNIKREKFREHLYLNDLLPLQSTLPGRCGVASMSSQVCCRRPTRFNPPSQMNGVMRTT